MVDVAHTPCLAGRIPFRRYNQSFGAEFRHFERYVACTCPFCSLLVRFVCAVSFRPEKRSPLDTALHTLLAAVLCGCAVIFLTPSRLEVAFGPSAATVLCLTGLLTVMIVHYSLLVAAPTEPTVFRAEIRSVCWASCGCICYCLYTVVMEVFPCVRVYPTKVHVCLLSMHQKPHHKKNKKISVYVFFFRCIE